MQSIPCYSYLGYIEMSHTQRTKGKEWFPAGWYIPGLLLSTKSGPGVGPILAVKSGSLFTWTNFRVTESCYLLGLKKGKSCNATGLRSAPDPKHSPYPFAGGRHAPPLTKSYVGTPYTNIESWLCQWLLTGKKGLSEPNHSSLAEKG